MMFVKIDVSQIGLEIWIRTLALNAILSLYFFLQNVLKPSVLKVRYELG